jgi:hypothetical protein
MRSRVIAVVVGVVLTLGMAEGLMRILDSRLPTGSAWPSIESEAKFEGLRAFSEADVVFLGSSITEAAIDPVELTEGSRIDSAYNSGIPFSTPYSNEWWLNEVVLRQTKPDMVVLGLTAWSGGLGPDRDPLLDKFEEAIGSDDRSGIALLEHAGLLSEWDSRSADSRARDSLTEMGHQTGYYDRSIEDATPLELPFGPSEMPRAEAEAVGRMIDRLREEGIQPLVMVEPGRYPGDNGGIDYDRYIDSVLSHEVEWGVPVLDTFHMRWDRDLFADLAHFNRRGTQEFTSLMAQTIDGLRAERSSQPGRIPADGP